MVHSFYSMHEKLPEQTEVFFFIYLTAGSSWKTCFFQRSSVFILRFYLMYLAIFTASNKATLL